MKQEQVKAKKNKQRKNLKEELNKPDLKKQLT